MKHTILKFAVSIMCFAEIDSSAIDRIMPKPHHSYQLCAAPNPKHETTMQEAASRIVTPAHLCKNKSPKGGEIGTRYGRLVIESFEGRDVNGEAFVKARCDCVNSFFGTLSHLRSGHTLSCGCIHRELHAKMLTTHGHTKGRFYTPEYTAWKNIISRCFNKKSKSYPRYGGRGVEVCERWRVSFEEFYADMGDKPSPHHSIERVKNDLGYSAENCKWATRLEQGKNKRNNIYVLMGGERLIAAEVGRRLTISPTSITYRVKKAAKNNKSSFLFMGILFEIP